MNLHDEITSEKGKENVLNCWKAATILDAVEMGSAKLKCFDPFYNIDLFRGNSISFKNDFQFPEESNPDVNERYESIQMQNMFRMTFDAIIV